MRSWKFLALAAVFLAACSKKTAMPAPKELGTFEVVSQKLYVIDPGYPPGKDFENLGGVVSAAKKGTWSLAVVYVKAGDAGVRCAELHARHASLPSSAGLAWKTESSLVGVDSGQAGIFDSKYYYKSEIVPKDHRWKEKPIDPDSPWYSLCCELTLGPAQAGVIPFGGLSSSGYGDGAYEWESATDGSGEVVAVRVVFLKPGDY